MTNTATKVKSHDFDIQVVYRLTPRTEANGATSLAITKINCANKMNFSDNKVRKKLQPT